MHSFLIILPVLTLLCTVVLASPVITSDEKDCDFRLTRGGYDSFELSDSISKPEDTLECFCKLFPDPCSMPNEISERYDVAKLDMNSQDFIKAREECCRRRKDENKARKHDADSSHHGGYVDGATSGGYTPESRVSVDNIKTSGDPIAVEVNEAIDHSRSTIKARSGADSGVVARASTLSKGSST